MTAEKQRILIVRNIEDTIAEDSLRIAKIVIFQTKTDGPPRTVKEKRLKVVLD